MIEQPADEAVLKAIHRLQFNEDWNVYVNYFLEQLATLRAANDYAEGILLYRQQGAAQVLADIVSQGQTVREALHKMSKQQKVANLSTRRP